MRKDSPLVAEAEADFLRLVLRRAGDVRVHVVVRHGLSGSKGVYVREVLWWWCSLFVATQRKSGLARSGEVGATGISKVRLLPSTGAVAGERRWRGRHVMVPEIPLRTSFARSNRRQKCISRRNRRRRKNRRRRDSSGHPAASSPPPRQRTWAPPTKS